MLACEMANRRLARLSLCAILLVAATCSPLTNTPQPSVPVGVPTSSLRFNLAPSACSGQTPPPTSATCPLSSSVSNGYRATYSSGGTTYQEVRAAFRGIFLVPALRFASFAKRVPTAGSVFVGVIRRVALTDSLQQPQATDALFNCQVEDELRRPARPAAAYQKDDPGFFDLINKELALSPAPNGYVEMQTGGVYQTIGVYELPADFKSLRVTCFDPIQRLGYGAGPDISGQIAPTDVVIWRPDSP